MDIRQWLQETLESPSQELLPARTLDHDIRDWPDALPLALVDAIRRGRSSTGSPLKAAFPAPQAEQTFYKRLRTSSSEGDSSSICISSEGIPSNLVSSSAHHTYAKRPRYKTKADKYDFKERAKGREKRQKRDGKKGKGDRPARKPRKKQRYAHLTGLVHAFHAKNVPKERLTVSFGYSLLLLKPLFKNDRPLSWIQPNLASTFKGALQVP